MDCYGVIPEEWELVDIYQEHVCFFCGRRQKSGNRLATDHCHKTGKFRGLLCSQCNRLLGKIERLGWTIMTLGRVIEYMQSPPAVRALGKEVYGFPGRTGTKRHRDWLRKKKKNEQ